MSALLKILRWMIRDQRKALLRGALLAAVVLMMGAALLGLSGWFITASAAAGIAGAGVVFDVFRPSAMIRFLAMGRTAARYGERLLTHDATLRALASLRVRLLANLARADWEKLTRVRGAQALNRITADVDALDGLPLRLVLPVVAGLVTQLVAFVLIWWLVAPSVALIVLGGFVIGGALVVVLGARIARTPSRETETAAQDHRTRFIDLVGARTDLAVYGQLTAQTRAVEDAEATRRREATRLDRIERSAGAALSLVSAGVTTAVLFVAGGLAMDGDITPARAAIAIFASLALMETIAPLRRTMAEQGRLMQAARRVASDMEVTPAKSTQVVRTQAPLGVEAIHFARRAGGREILTDVSLTVAPGETVALTGPSGSGKSTLLLIAAGLIVPTSGHVSLSGIDLTELDESSLRAAITLVPQRAQLIQGTVAENLRLADPESDDDALWSALNAAALDTVIRDKGGLSAPLGPRGSGLSGGESRRLVLARGLLRKPAVLLLDEPTEGLDRARAEIVMANIRATLPDAAILIASHRPEERAAADRTLQLVAGLTG